MLDVLHFIYIIIYLYCWIYIDACEQFDRVCVCVALKDDCVLIFDLFVERKRVSSIRRWCILINDN